MMQQHEAFMQRQVASLEQQQLVMQQMEAARVSAEDAHRQHMEALRQLEENRATAPVFALSRDHQSESGVWKTS